MRKYLLFVDTETSGIPDNMDIPLMHTDKWPFVLQIAWQIHKLDGTLVKKENHFIFEPEIEIQESSILIHGITIEKLKNDGTNRKIAVKQFLRDLRSYKPMIVGHFLEFDFKMLQVMLIRSGLKNSLKGYPLFCTMRTTSDYANEPGRSHPSLQVLYQSLFNKALTEQHSADIDVEATAKCFFELYYRGEIKEQMISDVRTFVKVKDESNSKTGCGLPAMILILLLAYFLML